LEVVPGITGLWQISGRSNVDFDERVRLDVAYIEKRSFWYDLKILAGTAGAILGQRGAC
jgi:lipopolysaccharide/colanic/teichoic acid biosynthesis glycosyltransferase